MIPCDRRTAELLINESLSTEETILFEEHLAVCQSCQKLLMEVAGGSKALDTATAMLSSSTEMPVWSEKQSSQVGFRSGEHTRSGHSVDLSFLGPTDDPASMGRIGNYEIQGIIGRGGMGIVFRAVDSALSRNVALKILDPGSIEASIAFAWLTLDSHESTAMRWKVIGAVITTVIFVACFSIWLTWPAPEIQTRHAELTSSVERPPLWSNDGMESVRKHAHEIEQSYYGSDAIPVTDPFENELRRLKRELDVFEKQNP